MAPSRSPGTDIHDLRHIDFLIRITPDDLAGPDQILQLGVKPNRIDVIPSLAGVSFDVAWESRVPGSIDGVPVSFIGRDALILNKESTGRLQDRSDALALRRRVPKGDLD